MGFASLDWSASTLTAVPFLPAIRASQVRIVIFGIEAQNRSAVFAVRKPSRSQISS